MSRFFRALVIVLLAASCGGGGGTSAPRNLDDACSILQQRPGYLRAFRAAERKWGVPVHVQMASMYQESKFKSDARTPFRYTLGVIPMGRQSSAYGYSQALNGTWEEYQQDQRKFRAKRNDISDATDFMGWYMAESNRRLGISLADARNQYLAYHEGRTGFSRGTYNSKAWLLRVADEVASRSVTYQGQLARCPVRR
ncbi:MULTISPECIES: transglycosylase SLT domain-containing protein [Marivita]|uniref:Lytic transglycosylase n=1 Tax=Marivita cryptomonadis TaxID=505252 RepID=A0A9Q2P7N2_9RHOB|nr:MULTISPECIES: transglycosylase SLT domain-containing protein [Marivita]MCR9168780.1 lytic transglycosylase [Paracoccaceae bacterium]MBM2319861.1 lytic transglycosylase [Marivita cryptomonadis]MBM2329440.1 lytic transglycosylase [Marivita cryptomonadis]MBM2339028.1 lytic transglycosylase [Marivita cryptomonadis]MBM2343686.1 lytic transglycosylase [Marivita cryptomonadis]